MQSRNVTRDDEEQKATRRRHDLMASVAASRQGTAAVRALEAAAPLPVPEMLTVADAMALGRIGKTAIYAAASKGAFPLKKFGRRTLIPRAAFMAFLHGLPDAETRKTAA